MARTPLTSSQRIGKVLAASVQLEAALAVAQRKNTAEAWATVEEHGATIHRQSRILAGKSRGG